MIRSGRHFPMFVVHQIFNFFKLIFDTFLLLDREMGGDSDDDDVSIVLESMLLNNFGPKFTIYNLDLQFSAILPNLREKTHF
jgi:hypothetical protein